MSNQQVALLHHINPSNAQQTAIALANAHLLREVITTVAFTMDTAEWTWLNWLPTPLKNALQSELSRRRWNLPSGTCLQTYPWQELVRIALSRSRLESYLGIRPAALVDWVTVSLDRWVAYTRLDGLNAIYCYEDVAAETFEQAKQKRILCFYDLPIPFHQTTRQIMSEEAEKFPYLVSSIQSIQDPEWKLKRKEREIELADHIFVASSVTHRSLLEIGISSHRITTIPYGAPIDLFQPQLKPDNRFRALFVGRISPRKGVHYLMQAWQSLRFPDAELVLVGSDLFPRGWLEQYRSQIRHIPSTPHLLLNQYYSSASVLVFPSLIEGFGLVLLEAMAYGIPVITTPNTAGPDILTDGIEGFIVPIRDVEALKDRLDWCYHHPVELAEMGCSARQRAEQLHWGVYHQHLTRKVKDLLEKHNSDTIRLT